MDPITPESFLSQLTAKTEPRPTVEGHVGPADVRQLGTFPPLRSKIVGVVAVYVFSSVEVVGHDPDAYVSRDKDGILAVWSAATG